MGRQANWGSVQIVVTGPVTKTWSEVANLQYDLRGQALTGKADLDLYSTAKVLIAADPMITITSEDDKNAETIPWGTTGTFSCSHRDAIGGTAHTTITVTNAKVTNISGGGAHAGWGALTHSIECISTDGTTSPFTLAVA